MKHLAHGGKDRENQTNTRRFVVLTAVLAAVNTGVFAQQPSGPAAHWQGTIQIPEHELGITVDLARDPNGAWIGSMSVLGSTAVDVPLINIAVGDTGVRFAASLPDRATFDGRLSADATKLSGTAANVQGEATFQLERRGNAKVSVPPRSSPLSRGFEGSWQGTLDDGGKAMRIGLKLSSAADRTATATLISLDQQNAEIPVTTVTLNGKELKLEVRAVSGVYRGILDASGAIDGEWSQCANRIPLTFKRVSPETTKP